MVPNGRVGDAAMDENDGFGAGTAFLVVEFGAFDLHHAPGAGWEAAAAFCGGA